MATQTLEKEFVSLVRSNYPKFEVQPFTRIDALEGVAAVHRHLHCRRRRSARTPAQGVVPGVPRDARPALRQDRFEGVRRSRTEGVATPRLCSTSSTAPPRVPDAATDGYVKTCQGTRARRPDQPQLLGQARRRGPDQRRPSRLTKAGATRTRSISTAWRRTHAPGRPAAGPQRHLPERLEPGPQGRGRGGLSGASSTTASRTSAWRSSSCSGPAPPCSSTSRGWRSPIPSG